MSDDFNDYLKNDGTPVSDETTNETTDSISDSEERYSTPLYYDNTVREADSTENPADNTDNTHSGISPKPRHIFKTLVASICIIALLGGAVFGGAWLNNNGYLSKKDAGDSKSAVSEEKSSDNNENKAGLTKADTDSSNETVSYTQTGSNLSVQDIVKNCLPSVVAITNVGVTEVYTLWGTYTEPSEGEGSGVIVAQTDDELLILTNYHVVKGSDELTVVFSYDEKSEEPNAVKANIKGYKEDLDLAVIAINLSDIDEDVFDRISVAVVGDSDALELGEQVVAIGNALGYGQSVTTGIVSALDRVVSIADNDGTVLTNSYIQTDAAINPGNSGGALLNMKGELVGINSGKTSKTSVEGVGYAIPITDVYDVIESMMNQETKVSLDEKDQGYLCISGQDIDSTTASMYNVPQGIYVTDVYEGFAADKAGLEEGDIIYEINGVTVSNMKALKEELSYCEGGSEIEVKYVRYSKGSNSYEKQSATVTLSTYAEFSDLSTTEAPSEGDSAPGNSSDDFWDYFYGK